MWNTTILLFIVLFVLAWAMSDSLFAEFLIFVFSIATFNQMIQTTAYATLIDYQLGAYLYILNSIFAFLAMMQWVIEYRINKKNQTENR